MLFELLMKFPLVFKLAYKLKYLCGIGRLRRQKLFYKYLSHHLDWSQVMVDNEYENPTVRKNKTIWVLWSQGIENAPFLVQKCVNSIDQYKGDYDVILLDNSNLSEYVRLPDHIERLYKEKIMGEALHSDMVRLYLMIHYGGIWRDATCYQTAPYPDYVAESPFFMFSADLLTEMPIVCSSWFIKADYGNMLLRKTYNFLCEYHKRYSRPHDYFVFHLILSLLVREDEECKRIWDEMPYVCNMNPHVFYFSFPKLYTSELYEHIMSSCFIHKLTYRYESKKYGGNMTIYDFFMS